MDLVEVPQRQKHHPPPVLGQGYVWRNSSASWGIWGLPDGCFEIIGDPARVMPSAVIFRWSLAVRKQRKGYIIIQFGNRDFVFNYRIFNWIINRIYNKFSILIGSLRAYLSCDRRAITWLSNYRCPISTFYNWHPRDSHDNYARFKGFLRNVPFSFQNLGNALQTFSRKEALVRHF